MNSQYFENLEILFKKKVKGLSDLQPTNYRNFIKCTLHYQGNYIVIETNPQTNSVGMMKYTVFPLKSIKEFRSTYQIEQK